MPGRRKRNQEHRERVAAALLADDEPLPEGEEWIEWGGELLWTAGFTSGGAPYGLTVDEFRRYNARDQPRAGWARAKLVLEEVLERWAGPPAVASVGRVKKIGDGLSREIFAAEAEVELPGSVLRGDYAVALPRRDSDPELAQRTRRELHLMGRLEREQLPFRVPKVIGLLPEQAGLALVRDLMSGFELDTRAGRRQGVLPWEVIATIAATVHSLDVARFTDIVPGYESRRQHARAQLAVFDGVPGEELSKARAWCASHLPPEDPAALLHGDLLGQNILLGLGEHEPPAVIDWEYALRGDPAYELAIVTRGVRRPFQVAGGLDRLLDAYHQRGGISVTREQVHLHEICLAVGWYRASLAGHGRHPREQALAKVQGILRRARV